MALWCFAFSLISSLNNETPMSWGMDQLSWLNFKCTCVPHPYMKLPTEKVQAINWRLRERFWWQMAGSGTLPTYVPVHIVFAYHVGK